MRAPRALFCTDTFPPQLNGVSVVTAISVNGLLDRGWTCGVVAPEYPKVWTNPFHQPDDRITMTVLPSAPLPTYPDIRVCLPLIHRVARAIDTLEPDIVHVQTEFIIGQLGARIARRRGIPVVTSYHTDFGKYATAYGLGFLRPAVTRSLSRFHARAARTYTPGVPSAHELRSSGVTDVEVWGRGVDIDIFHPGRRSPDLRRKLGIDDAFVFLHVGRLAAEKGVERILSAFAIARQSLAPQPVKLVIAGAGPCEDALRRAAPPDTIFLGRLDRTTELPALYASADAFLFSSTTETLGLVVLEAMASGTPVIAAPAGGVADHLRDEENGLAYPPNDTSRFALAMERLACDDSLRRQLSAGARRTAEGRSWTSELDRLDESYREVIDACAAVRAEREKSPPDRYAFVVR